MGMRSLGVLVRAQKRGRKVAGDIAHNQIIGPLG